MKSIGKQYFDICKILDSKLSVKEANLIKDFIEKLSKDNQVYISILDNISFQSDRFKKY